MVSLELGQNVRGCVIARSVRFRLGWKYAANSYIAWGPLSHNMVELGHSVRATMMGYRFGLVFVLRRTELSEISVFSMPFLLLPWFLLL